VTRQSGSGRPKSARTVHNTAAVGDMICSQEDQPGRPTSKSFRQIAKTLGMSDRSVWRIAKMDLELSAIRRMPAQVLSDAVKLKRLERCRALLRRLTVNKLKQVFFADEENFYLNPPVSKSVKILLTFPRTGSFACICDAAIALCLLSCKITLSSSDSRRPNFFQRSNILIQFSEYLAILIDSK